MEHRLSDDAVLTAKLNDAVRAARTGCPHFIGFLDEREAALTRAHMAKIKFENYMLWGGYADAERVVFGAFPDYLNPQDDSFPILAVTVHYRTCDELSHRDFLGALLSHGVVRETIGDILVEPGRTVLFVRKEIADFLLQQTEKIGKVGVRFDLGAKEPLPVPHTFEPFSAVVASARLDCITAAVTGMSREKAVGLITTGFVMLDHVVMTSVSVPIQEGTKLSIRGKGRYVIDHADAVTKKKRLRIEGRKYI